MASPPKTVEEFGVEVPQKDTKGLKKSRQKLSKERKRLIDKIQKSIGGVPHLAELTEHLLDKFGGADQLAKEYHKTYVQAAEGSQTRARMLEKVIDLIRLNAQLFGSVGDLDTLSDQELMAMASLALGEMLAGEQPEEAPPPLPDAALPTPEPPEKLENEKTVLSSESSDGEQ